MIGDVKQIVVGVGIPPEERDLSVNAVVDAACELVAALAVARCHQIIHSRPRWPMKFGLGKYWIIWLGDRIPSLLRNYVSGKRLIAVERVADRLASSAEVVRLSSRRSEQGPAG